MSQENETFQRCPHDKEHPYSMVSRDLIRDKSISPACRWLLIYLLSNKEGWNIHIREIVNHCNGMIGRDKIYKLIKEAISAGYIMREDYFANVEVIKGGKTVVFKNLPRFRYFVSEFPKFKKCFRHPGFQEVDFHIPENKDGKEEASSKNKQEEDLSPIIPKGDPPPSKRKKVREEKEEKAQQVWLTTTQHLDLTKRMEGDEKKVLACYERLSRWKISKQIAGGNDYLSILNWVIKAVEEEKTQCKTKIYPSKSSKCSETFSARDTSGLILVPLASIINTECILTRGLKKERESSSLQGSPGVGKLISAPL